MNIAVIDTETSGLFDFSKPADAEGQPRLASLAVVLLHEDLSIVSTHEFLIKPDGWEMAAEAGAVNGLTTEHLIANGRPVKEALDFYVKLIDEGFIIGSFNAQFDTKMLRGELRRADMDDRFERTNNICVMRALTDICQIPKKTGRGWKFPKLQEACQHFKIEQPKAHSAMGDALSAVALLRELKRLNAVPVPEVHYAKNRPIDPQAPAAT